MGDETGQLFGGGWTEDKLQILKEYLTSYNTALKKQGFRRIYIDAFAGTGYRRQRRKETGNLDLFWDLSEGEPEQFLKGSAKLALEVTPAFHNYVFIESDPSKILELEKLREEHPAKADQIDIIQSDANDFVQRYCTNTDWRNTRAVIFLDPFATEVVWGTIEAIARTRAIDVWILFPLMAVNRLLARDPKKAFRSRLDKFFGTDDWFPRFYGASDQHGLFVKADEQIKRSSFAEIGSFFQERRGSVFAGVAPTAKVFRNSTGTPLFQFFFAASNAAGARIAVRIAEHLLKRI